MWCRSLSLGIIEAWPEAEGAQGSGQVRGVTRRNLPIPAEWTLHRHAQRVCVYRECPLKDRLPSLKSNTHSVPLATVCQAGP